MKYINGLSKFLIFCFYFILIYKLRETNIIVKNTKIDNIKDREEEKTIINKNINKNKRIIKDVLFINGCNNKFLPHPYRYRVVHQMEQLNAAFLESDEFYYLNFEPNIIYNYRVIIFFRCPWTDKVDQAIKLAKSLNKKVLFDIDDLVIDTKYTEKIPYLKTLSPDQKNLYDDGVMRIGKTLKLCDGAITTTNALAKELKNYIHNVFINRNVASEEMWKLSKDALKLKYSQGVNDYIIIGYFSGSITHNSDIELIKPALIKILKEYNNVKLLLSGLIRYSKDFNDFNNQIITKNFTDWRKLPEIISNVDINIAPLEDTLFNEAKSENKWVEASLVKVPTIASNIGAFKHVIIHNETGLLCNNINDWYISLKTLIDNENLRRVIGENAYKKCNKKYNSIANKHIGFFLPFIKIFGGIYVILKHACILQDLGWDVDLIVPDKTNTTFEFQNHIFNVISLDSSIIGSFFDITIATLFTTLYSALKFYNTKKVLYLVQGYETDFYSYGEYFRPIAEKTYFMPLNFQYITISKWCEKWLWKNYRKKAKYAPNGIDLDNYNWHKRDLTKKKVRILIEGDSSTFYKNVDESFKIVEDLDKNNYEIWYLSNHGKPKDWYKVDNFLNEIPYEKVIEIYSQCDILIKSSMVESFSYPPLEMMATGGYAIVAQNDGNKEYLRDGENCLLYKLGDINGAANCINRLISDEKLQEHLYINGLATAQKRDWKNLKDKIISLYTD